MLRYMDSWEQQEDESVLMGIEILNLLHEELIYRNDRKYIPILNIFYASCILHWLSGHHPEYSV